MIEKREKGMTGWTKANDFPVPDNTFTISNLAENSEYEFRIAAVNAAGAGEPSLACAPIKIKEKVGKGHLMTTYSCVVAIIKILNLQLSVKHYLCTACVV